MSADRCPCTADDELAYGPVCHSCGHRDHGRSGCLAPLASETTDAGLDAAWEALLDEVHVFGESTVEKHRPLIDVAYRATLDAALAATPSDPEAYVRGHWDGLHCEANGFGGILDECEHVGRIHEPKPRAAAPCEDGQGHRDSNGTFQCDTGATTGGEGTWTQKGEPCHR